MQIFVVEKYAIARDATLFEKDAQVRRYFEDARLALRKCDFLKKADISGGL